MTVRNPPIKISRELLESAANWLEAYIMDLQYPEIAPIQKEEKIVWVDELLDDIYDILGGEVELEHRHNLKG